MAANAASSAPFPGPPPPPEIAEAAASAASDADFPDALPPPPSGDGSGDGRGDGSRNGSGGDDDGDGDDDDDDDDEDEDEDGDDPPPESPTTVSSGPESASSSTRCASNVSDVRKLEDAKRKLKTKLKKAEDELVKVRSNLAGEKAAKRKLYSSLVRLATELKATRAETEGLIEAAQYAGRNWYEGGMWRAPSLLPGVCEGNDFGDNPARTSREAVSLSDLFLDLIVVTAFTRVGVAVQDRGEVDGPVLAYMAVFWFVWSKEASYSTRFDTTDLSSQAETLLTCFAVLFGSLSCGDDFNTPDGTRVMMVGAFVAVLHFLLHLRVYLWFRDADVGSELHSVKMYGSLQMIMTAMEAAVWCVGIFAVPEEWEGRWVVFLVAVLLELRVPKAFLANDFHAACSKRGVLFILLLGFIMQSVIVKATPFFVDGGATAQRYSFVGAACFLLYSIKLLYVDDSYSLDPRDHALLVNRAAGFCFHLGQYFLLLSTTVLGAGLDLLTESYMASTAALSNNSKNLVCGGFSAVVLAILFIKSMHVRRVPTHPGQARLFYAAYAVQALFVLAIVLTGAAMCLARNGFLAYLMLNEIEMLSVLCGFALLLVVMSWLDEAVDLSLYGGGPEAREFRVHPFGIWWCCLSETVEVDAVPGDGTPGPPDGRLSVLSPLLSGSMTNSSRYASLSADSLEGAAGAAAAVPKPKDKKARSVSFDEKV